MKQSLIGEQLNIVDLFDFEREENIGKSKISVGGSGVNYDNYDLHKYQEDVLNLGLKQAWDNIINYVLNVETTNEFLFWQNFAELYETGLSIQDKQLKKESGQYYTPDDVAVVMSTWLYRQSGENVCDVGCGTGKLILAYLDLIGKDKAIELIRGGKLYLYDIDDVALNICKTTLLLKYGKDLEPFINAIHCDFLSRKISLPKNCKVISNPPYARVNALNSDWEKTEISLNTKEYYSMFMEKILKQSKSSVIITPYSFVGGNKFYTLRKLMNNYNGFVVSFDNVPGNIFHGKKHGIFNSNKANSVRAVITVVENKKEHNGFRISPLIRFKNEERGRLLNVNTLESFIDDEYQIIDEKNRMYYKCAKELKTVWSAWKSASDKSLGDYISQNGSNIISMPNTCRYFTTASNGIMNRNGQIVLTIDDKDVFNYIFCMVNSSVAYWYWRLYDGGITYTRGLLLKMPVFYNKLTEEDKMFFRETTSKMIKDAPKYIVTKNNIGVQENIKYPREFRDKINRRFLDILGLKNTDEKIFDVIHSNMALEINV